MSEENRHTDSYRSLVRAEIEYARYNARRTGQVTDGIELFVTEGTSCLLDPNRPDIPYFNRAVLSPDLTSVEESVKQLPEAIRAVEVLIPQQTAHTAEVLLNAGFIPGDSLCYLVQEPKETRPVKDRVNRLNADEADHFFDLLGLSGVEFSEEKRELKRAFYGNDTFRCYASCSDEGEPTGWATMYVSEGTAFFANMFTLPQFRRQGIHASLLTARLNDVVDLGLLCAFTDVVPASASHRNCERGGFRILTNNVIWVRKD